METLSEAQDDSSGANPSSVKSEDGSPPPDDGRGSPPPNCAICLGRCKNKSFTDSCLHQFCFKCLLTWSKVKTECPLCKQNFKSIIHNVQSNQQYEEYRVEQRRQEEDRLDINDLVTATRRFRYRTTLTFPRGGEHMALQRLLMHYPPLSAMVGIPRDLPGIMPAALPASRRRRSPSSFRRTVYRHNLWARPLPDFTGRHRDCTPEFYRYNDSQMHRLVPWLNRELHYLLLENAGHITYVLQRILELLPQYHITSPEFREEMYRYFGSRTDHFLHELHCFASTPYDLTGYDRSVQYTTDSRISNTINDLSSSDTESGDSDIVEVLVTPPFNRSRSTPPTHRPVTPILPSPYEPNPGPSASHRSTDPAYPLNLITAPNETPRYTRQTTGSPSARNLMSMEMPTQTIIPIDTISHSDTDDDVMVTGYIKPPNQRTPEVVDLRDSDNDSVVVVTDTMDPQLRCGPVKLTLSRPRILSPSETEDETYMPPQNRRSLSSQSMRYSEVPLQSPPQASTRTPKSSPPSRIGSDADYDTSDDDVIVLRRNIDKKTRNQSTGSSNVKRLTRRKRTRRSEDAERESGAASASTSMPSTSSVADSSGSSPEKDKRKKSKSNNGKGVKSSRKDTSMTESRRPEPVNTDEPPHKSSRKGITSSQGDASTETNEAKSTAVQEDPQPGPSHRPSGRVKPLETKRTETTSVQEEAGSSGIQGQKTSRWWATMIRDGKASRTDEPTELRKVQEVAYPASSSRPTVKGVKSSRKDEPSESRRAESTTVHEEQQPGPSRSSTRTGKPRRDDQSESRRPEVTTSQAQQSESSRSSGKGGKSSRRADSTLMQEDKYSGSSSRPNGKGVKSSRKDESTESRRVESSTEARPGPSSQAGPSNLKRKNTDEVHVRHNSRENKRLKSVVKKASGSTSSSQASTSRDFNPLSPDFFTDSDDDIPLNLTIQRSLGLS